MYSKYDQEVARFDKKDAIIALCTMIPLWLVIVFVTNPMIFNIVNSDPTSLQFRLATGLTSFICLSVAVVILVRKQGFTSIGLHREKLLKALIPAILLSCIPLFFGLLPVFLYGGEFVGIMPFALSILTVFLSAAAEDISFIGLMQTRIHGLIKSSKIAICVIAAVFSLLHVPFFIVQGGDMLSLSVMLVVWFVMYLVLVDVFRMYFSLFALVLFHTMINLTTPHHIWVFEPEYAEYASQWHQTSFLVIIPAIVIWAIVRRIKANKEANQAKKNRL